MPDALITPDLTPDEALRRFKAACNTGPDVLFITESWFAPFERRLRACLPAPIGDRAAAALEDAVREDRPLRTVVEFLERQPMTWHEYEQWRIDEDLREWLADLERGIFRWKDVEWSRRKTRRESRQPPMELLNQAMNCPKCHRRGRDLTWIYFRRPEWEWSDLVWHLPLLKNFRPCRCGRYWDCRRTRGWLTLCEPCHLQVDFFRDPAF